VINDLVDLSKDRRHPDKKSRPLASGRIGQVTGILFSVVLLLIGGFIGYSLGLEFLYIVLVLFLVSLLYTFFLKKILIADVLTISTLFVIRAISGAILIGVVISPWLILVPFFLALFLAVGKRHADLLLLKEGASATRKVLKEYNNGLTNSLMIIATTLLLISYALYSFLSEYNTLLYTLPFALFVIVRYYYLISLGSEIARKPEKVIKDVPIVIGSLLWVIIAGVLIYI